MAKTKARRVTTVEVDPCNWKRSEDPNSRKAWDATGRMVEQLAARSEIPKRRYVLRVMRKHRGNGRPKGDLKVGRVEGQTVLLSTKPGDNDSVWTYCLMVPHEMDPHGVQAAMMKANGQDPNVEPDDVGQPAGVPDVAERAANPQPDSAVAVTVPAGGAGSAGHFLKGLQEVQQILEAAEAQQARLAELEGAADQLRDQLEAAEATAARLRTAIEKNEAEQLKLMDDLANDESFKMAELVRDQLGRMFLGKVRPDRHGPGKVNGHG